MNKTLRKFCSKFRSRQAANGRASGDREGIVEIDRTTGTSQTDASFISKARKGEAIRPASCDFCLEPFPLDEIYVCRNQQKHGFCSSCIQQYVQNWVEDETWPELKRQFDGSNALPCLLEGHDDDDGRAVHYLPMATLRQSVDENLLRRFETKMDRISVLCAAVEEDSSPTGNDEEITVQKQSEAPTDNDMDSAGPDTAETFMTELPTPNSNELPNLTCQCCYENIIESRLIEDGHRCNNEQHLFCVNCIGRYVEEWLYGGTMSAMRLQKTPNGDWALPCLATGEQEQPHYLPMTAVQPSVSDQVFKQFVEKIETTVLFQEQQYRHDQSGPSNAALEVATTSEAQKLDQSYYHQAAEALTEATMRRCPSCHAQFYKETNSCNKVRCPHCRATMCYVCRRALPHSQSVDSIFTHFCTHRSELDRNCQVCSKCPLWSYYRQEEDDDQERRKLVARDVANRTWEDLLLSRDDGSHDLSEEIERTIKALL